MNLEISNSIKTLTRAQKLEKVLDLIEYFEVKENKVIIGLNKDVVLVTKGDLISITQGAKVSFANEIHFNPEINPNKVLNDNFVEELRNSIPQQGCLSEEP